MESKEPTKMLKLILENRNLDSFKTVIRDNMDDINKKAFDIATQKDKPPEVAIKESVKYMLTDSKTGKPLSYAEMRYLYG